MSKPRLQVVIVTDPTYAYGRKIIRGATAYLQSTNLPIDLHVLHLGFAVGTERIPSFDGYLQGFPDYKIPELPSSKPVVAVVSQEEAKGALCITPDNYAIGVAAANALHARGVVSYGYYDGERPDDHFAKRHGEQRLDGFRERLAALGVEDIEDRLHIHQPSAAEDCFRFVSALPKPAGISTWNDYGGLKVAEACRLLHLNIPKWPLSARSTVNWSVRSATHPCRASIWTLSR